MEAYLSLLESLDAQIQNGAPLLKENDQIRVVITVQQQKILYSSVYLQLYNLVESTVSNCIKSVTDALTANDVRAKQLNESILKEWVRSIGRTHIDLSYENRLESLLIVSSHLLVDAPISKSDFVVEKGGGGNWDDVEIENICKRLGWTLKIDTTAYKSVKRKYRNDLGILGYLKSLRNDLAHGSISFEECGEGETVSNLRELAKNVFSYLLELVKFFEKKVSSQDFLLPEHRPAHSVR
ncbi:MAG: hypothetical protein EOO45_03280 [Flavobacterium sp.]|nr:MAG: hypothetical protein EOO45_03280 [Flavobacterium sp.]